jgi:3-oxoacyl-[acyl-carrier protein] reductase
LAQRVSVVAALDVPGSDLGATRLQCEAAGTTFVSLMADITDEAGVTSELARLVSGAGPVDILVNNAGIAPTRDGRALSTLDMSVEEWRRVIEVNLTGAFIVTRAVLPGMIGSGWGRIVNMISQTARLASAGAGAHYGSSKAALLAFTRVLALEWSEHGITANCVAPGLTETPLGATFDFGAYASETPNRRIGQPEDSAAAVDFLTGQEALHITGAVIDVNGGRFMG